MRERATSTARGSVEEGFDASLRRAFAIGLAVWQLVMIGAVLVTETRVPSGPLVVMHVGTAVTALLVAAGRLPFLPTVVACYAFWGVDYLACDDFDGALLLAGCWYGNLLYAITALLFTRWVAIALPIVGAAAVGATVLVARADWDLDRATAIVVTAAAIVAAARPAIGFLRGLAVAADHEASLSEAESRSRDAAREAGRQAAEDARVIHDTVINTLGALANGVARGQLAEVRTRCHDDAEAINTMIAGRRLETPLSLVGIEAEGWGIEVIRTGLRGDELLRQEALMKSEALHALRTAANELIRNAVKHAGVERVEVEITRAKSSLQITVRDQGAGFDTNLVTRRGLTTSVADRVEAAGGEVDVRSAPGRGTRARIACPLATEVTAPIDPDDRTARTEATVDAIREHAAWVWTGAVLAVGLVIEAINRPGQLTTTYLMLAMVAGASTLVLWSVRRGAPSQWVSGAVIAVTPAAFIAGMDGVDFGRTDVMYYQAIGVTPLLVLLLTFAGVRGLQVGVVVLGVAALATAVVVWPDSRDAGVCVVVGVIPAIGLSLGWLGFHRLVRSLVEKTESERASLWRAQREAAARIEVEAARRRWRGAALSAALDLLGGVSSQQLDPSDPDVQHRCADEEEYLRQLILLSPDSYRMNAWFARSLAESRSRGVRFVVRGGDADVRDDDSAQLLGQTIIAAVSASPPGTAVTAGLYPANGGVRLVLVGERGSLAPVAEPADIAAAGMRVDFSAVGEQDVLEISPADDGESCLA